MSQYTLNRAQLAQICSSQVWQRSMELSAPFENQKALRDAANKAFDLLEEHDWLEAFAGHPMIGDLSTLQAKYAQAKELSKEEQSSVQHASQDTLVALLELNQQYVKTFGFIFIVCATNKSADEMLRLLKSRLTNSRNTELLNAAKEQRAISSIRMEAYV
ncbi:2-oxo-4-hydroxy-4-carboxy-5-ureidoimidazoline decarboxylase [Vibrio maerlii]|uniref:2-oxo-4-hydroxy-4-carboxy-5-ureidoimidazoline decarboxylase n=1 Tax=Vibrio maerlii TaxID=2231648 RepID=UPI000E3D4EB2|nr:2-oxo-4-hydroxy-4-carboxy-5-ureidoimidazoline decarboxylase [Vibrio maerlii]